MWTKDDFFEYTDWNNILHNVKKVHSDYLKVNGKAPNLTGNYIDRSQTENIISYLPTDINGIEKDIANISSTFKAKTYSSNGFAPDYAEINRIETEILALSTLWTPSAKIQPRLAFRLSTSKLRF